MARHGDRSHQGHCRERHRPLPTDLRKTPEDLVEECKTLKAYFTESCSPRNLPFGCALNAAIQGQQPHAERFPGEVHLGHGEEAFDMISFDYRTPRRQALYLRHPLVAADIEHLHTKLLHKLIEAVLGLLTKVKREGLPESRTEPNSVGAREQSLGVVRRLRQEREEEKVLTNMSLHSPLPQRQGRPNPETRGTSDGIAHRIPTATAENGNSHSPDRVQSSHHPINDVGHQLLQQRQLQQLHAALLQRELQRKAAMRYWQGQHAPNQPEPSPVPAKPTAEPSTPQAQPDNPPVTIISADDAVATKVTDPTPQGEMSHSKHFDMLMSLLKNDPKMVDRLINEQYEIARKATAGVQKTVPARHDTTVEGSQATSTGICTPSSSEAWSVEQVSTEAGQTTEDAADKKKADMEATAAAPNVNKGKQRATVEEVEAWEMAEGG